ncbi:MAG: substrate-binding domain-containing protein [Propionivibrio sp.]|nr:substrate-binding domain-containing protein [Propionivibrio sp.]
MNLKQLSEKLGLSQTTVSRALNGYSDVSEATRQRVAEMALEHGYRPNTMARRLAMGRADAIGLIYPLDATYLGDPRFIEVLEGLTARLRDEQLDVLIASAGKDDELETYQRLIRTHRVDGLIVARTHLDDARIRYLRESKFPFVSYGRTADPSGFAWFDFDNAQGTRLAVERLVSFGHRRIAYLHADLDLNFAAQRHQGFLSAMQSAGLNADLALVREVGVLRRTAYAVMGELLARPDRPTAIIVDNNQAGVGVVRAILESGLRLGQDCSLIVYDGLPEDTLLDIANVTAIEQPTPEKVGRKLGDLMLGVLQGIEPTRLQVEWQPVLHAGNSDGPVPR